MMEKSATAAHLQRIVMRGVDLKVSLPLRLSLAADRLKGARCMFRYA
jgi:hypothetical protein